MDPTDPTVPSEPGVINSGSYGELTWVLYTNGLLQITGADPMPEEEAPLYNDRAADALYLLCCMLFPGRFPLK